MSQTETTSKRIEYIDALRGLSMILVINFHIPSYCLGDAYMGYNDIIGRFRMPLFFFISGFVFFKADRVWNLTNIKAILKKKFMVQIVSSSIFLIFYLYLFYSIDIMYLGSDKCGYWYTFVLFEFYVLYMSFEVLLNKNNTNRGETRVMISILSISLICFYYSKYYHHYAEFLGCWKYFLGVFSFVKLRLFFFFWLGIFVRKHLEAFIKICNNSYFITFIILLYIGMTSFPVVYHTTIIEFLAFLLTGLTGIIILFTYFRTHENCFNKDRWLGRILQFIGKRTLDIYFIHYFILPYNLQHIGSWLLQYDNKTFDLIFIIILSSWIICLSLAIGSIIRLSPLLAHYLLGVSYKNSTSNN